MNAHRHLSILLLALAALSGAPRPAATAPSYKIIAHPAVATTTLDRRFLADSFLKKTTRWPNGEVIRPVDLGPSSPVRRAFSDDILGRNVESVKIYWQQSIFSGRDVPPPELDGDDDVVRYVLKHPGAIGYVSGAADLGGAKLIAVR